MNNTHWTPADRRMLAHYLAQVNHGHVTLRPASSIISIVDRAVTAVVQLCSGILGALVVSAVLFLLALAWRTVTR